MEAQKETRPFDLAAAKAGAPYACRNGREATILKWDGRKPSLMLVGCMGQMDTPIAWSPDGRTGIPDTGFDLVMTPLGFIDGKPVFVGDEIELKCMAKPDEWKRVPVQPGWAGTWNDNGELARWPAPEKPRVVIINGGALNEAAWLIVEKIPGPIPAHIWNNIKLPLKAAIELWLAKQTEFDLHDRAARDMAVAEAVHQAAFEAVRDGGYEFVFARLNKLNLAAIIAGVGK